MAGHPWYNNGIEEKQIKTGEPIPNGWVRGRLKWPQERKDNWKGENNPMVVSRLIQKTLIV